jgi:hypothetical protein
MTPLALWDVLGILVCSIMRMCSSPMGPTMEDIIRYLPWREDIADPSKLSILKTCIICSYHPWLFSHAAFQTNILYWYRYRHNPKHVLCGHYHNLAQTCNQGSIFLPKMCILSMSTTGYFRTPKSALSQQIAI